MPEAMSCPEQRLRVITDGGCGYRIRLYCSESEGHKEEHYDDTFSQAWRDTEEEPECDTKTIVNAWAGWRL
jgi:hypothetical protein